MNLQNERIGQFCKQLELERVLSEYAAAAQTAVRDEAGFADFLESVLRAEADYRAERTRQMLAKLAGFPTVKTLDAFDFGFAVGVPRDRTQRAALQYAQLRRTSTRRRHGCRQACRWCGCKGPTAERRPVPPSPRRAREVQ